MGGARLDKRESLPVSDEPSSRHFLVRGLVQGVGFRHFVFLRAVEFGIRGWVRNLEDGGVEVAAWGSVDSLEDFGREIGRGPRWSRVEAMCSDQPLDSQCPPGPFTIRG